MNRVFYMFFLLGCSTDTFTGVDGDADPPGDSAVDPETSADGGTPESSPDASGEASSLDADAATLDALDAPVDGPSTTLRRVFVTSKTMTPDFGGLSQADAICMTAASSLGGNWKAWLSTSSTSAASRLEHATVPYKLLDGTEIAADWTHLTSGTLLHAIDLDEHKNLFATATVATGTDASGNATSHTCADWTNKTSSYSDTAGETTLQATDSSWTNAFSYVCSGSALVSLYCVEQP
jgi:hypothetical protein